MAVMALCVVSGILAGCKQATEDGGGENTGPNACAIITPRRVLNFSKYSDLSDMTASCNYCAVYFTLTGEDSSRDCTDRLTAFSSGNSIASVQCVKMDETYDYRLEIYFYEASSVTVTFSAGDCYGSITVTLPIHIGDSSYNDDTIYAAVGDSIAIPASKTGLTWKSETESVATVSSEGVVTAVAAGSSKITVTDGTNTVVTYVTVKKTTDATKYDTYIKLQAANSNDFGGAVKVRSQYLQKMQAMKCTQKSITMQ